MFIFMLNKRTRVRVTTLFGAGVSGLSAITLAVKWRAVFVPCAVQ